MNISNLFFEKIFATSNVSATSTQRPQQSSSAENNRNAGPDTVTLSAEAQEKYRAMKESAQQVSSTTHATHTQQTSSTQESSQQSLAAETFVNNTTSSPTTTSASPSEKLDDGAFLAFLKSEGFSKNAMAYVKTVAVETKGEEDDDTTNQVIKDLGQTTQTVPSDAPLVATEATEQNSNNNGLGSSDENTEEELAAAIAKAKQELEELSIAYEEIMSGEGLLEEKFRLGQPVYKQLKEKADQVMSLEAQARMQEIQAKKGQLDVA